MPTRIVREGILSSDAVNKLSERAELFYRRLISVADDHGRYFAHPTILRSACYPFRLETVSEADVQQMLGECLREELVFVYGGGKFLWIAKFGQQIRAKSKFPTPEPPKQPVKTQAVAIPTLIKCISSDVQVINPVGVGVGVEDVVEDVCEKPDFEKIMNGMKAVLLPLYSRKKEERLTSMEESFLFEVSRRPKATEELGELLAYRRREQKFFPRSLSALLSEWQKILDHARTGPALTLTPVRTATEQAALDAKNRREADKIRLHLEAKK